MAAVVEEDDVAAADVFGDGAFDCRGGRGAPVVAGDVPHDGFEAEFAGDAKNGGAASAEGWAEEVEGLAGCVFEGGAARREFLADFCLTFESQQRMSEGVIADGVSGLNDGAGDFWALVDVAADQKKSCVDIVAGEDVEQAKSVWVVGAVVIGEGELARTLGQASEGFSIPLAGWGHGLVAGGGCGNCAG